MKLYRGNCRAVGVESPFSQYASGLASFTMGGDYDQADARGFINLFGLPMKVAGRIDRKRPRRKR